MKHSIVIFSLFALILLLSLNSCSEPQDNIITPPPAFGDQIVPGEIVVGLDDTVTYSYANDFFSQFPFEIIQLNIDSLFAIWLEIEEGDPQEYISIISQIHLLCGLNKGDIPVKIGIRQKTICWHSLIR